MALPLWTRVLIVLVALVLMFSNVWRPWLGWALLQGPRGWAAFGAGILLILAALVNHPGDAKIRSS